MDSFWRWWQSLPLHIDPVIFEIGSFRPQYYGLMYVVAFAITYFLVVHRLKHEPRFTLTMAQMQDLVTGMIIGLLVGARLGYVFIYNLDYYLAHPLEIILPVKFDDGFQFTGISGMSYHGGLLGVALACFIYGRRHRVSFWQICDLFVPAIPLGYTFGRIGNFINGELYGRVTTLPVGMQFPLADARLRHPSQLYEALLEGVVLFAVLWPLRKCKFPTGAMLGLYLIGYGTARFIVEFFREPDAHIGFVALGLSMGQLLCAFMILAGVGLYGFRWMRQQPRS